MKRKRELLDTTAPDTNDTTNNNENNNIITTPKRLCQASTNTIATTTSTSSSSSHTIITNNTSSIQHNHHESSSSTSDGGGGASDWTMLAPNCLTNIFNFLSIHANHEAHATAATTTTTPTFPILQQQQRQHHNNNNNDRHSMMMSDPLVDPLWIVKYHSQVLLLTRHVHFSYEALVQLYQRNELWKFRFVLKNANSVSFHLHSLCSLCSLMNKRRLQRQQQQQLMSYNNNDNEDITSGIMTQGHFRQACLILDTIARAFTENLGLETLHIRTSCCKDNLSVIAPPPPPIPTLFPAQTTAKHSTTNNTTTTTATTKNNDNVSNDYHDDYHDDVEEEEEDVKQWKCTVVSTKRLMMMAIAPMDYLIHQWTKYISRYNHHKQSNNSDYKTNSSSNSNSRNRIKSGNSLRVISCQGSQSSQSLSELVRSFPNLCSLTYHCCSFSALDKDAFLPQLTRPTIRHVDLSTISNIDDGLVRVLIRIESLRWLTINTSHLSVDTVHEICASSQLRALEFSLHRLDDKSYEILRDNSTLELLRFPSIYEAKNLRTVLMNRGSLRQITANSSVDLDEDTLDPLKDNNTLEVLDISGSIVVNCLPLIHTRALKSICIGDEGDITVQEMVEAMGQDWFDALTVESFHLKSRYPIHFGNLLRERLPQRIVLVVDDFYSQDTGEEM